MNPSKSVEIRVGIFVFACIVIIGGMILRFGNIRPIQTGVYEITVSFTTADGLVPDTVVTYAGLRVGRVADIRLDESHSGRVNVRLAINQDVKIRRDARFVIAQTGLLGDRLVKIEPAGETAPFLEDGDRIEGAKMTDLAELMQTVNHVLGSAGQVIEKVQQAVTRIDAIVLSEPSLGRLTNTFANLDAASSNAVVLTRQAQDVITENREKLRVTMSELADASAQFKKATKQADALLAEGRAFIEKTGSLVDDNQDDIRRITGNLAETTERLNNILARLEQGHGTAGKLLTDDTLYQDLKQIAWTIQRYGLFFNTWLGRKVRPADRPSDAGPNSAPTLQFGEDKTKSMR